MCSQHPIACFAIGRVLNSGVPVALYSSAWESSIAIYVIIKSQSLFKRKLIGRIFTNAKRVFDSVHLTVFGAQGVLEHVLEERGSILDHMFRCKRLVKVAKWMHKQISIRVKVQGYFDRLAFRCLFQERLDLLRSGLREGRPTSEILRTWIA